MTDWMRHRMPFTRLHPWPVTACLVAALALSACIPEVVREGLGMGKQPPDEFQVVERAPLSLPPDFDLRPPKPGVARPQQVDIRKQAEEVLMGEAAAAKRDRIGYSPGEEALLKRAGALNVDPEIRLIVDRESSILAASDQSFVDNLMFWEGTLGEDEVLNPAREQQRLLGEDVPANEGLDGAPLIRRK